MRKTRKILTMITLLLVSLKLISQERNWKYKITPFSGIGKNTVSSFTGYNALWHLGGVAATFGIIHSGLDYKVHNYFFYNKELYMAASTPAVYIGYTVPVCLGAALYSIGFVKDNKKIAAAGCAVLQASLIAITENCLLKAFTGRPNPELLAYTATTDMSDYFRFGFLRGGIHYGWPSGHMAVTTAVVSSLSSFYTDSKITQAIAWASWSYMLFGVISHEGNTMHWTSDIVAGCMMGYAVGNNVGKNFRALYKDMSGNDKDVSLHIQPQFSKKQAGIQLNLEF